MALAGPTRRSYPVPFGGTGIRFADIMDLGAADPSAVSGDLMVAISGRKSMTFNTRTILTSLAGCAALALASTAMAQDTQSTAPKTEEPAAQPTATPTPAPTADAATTTAPAASDAAAPAPAADAAANATEKAAEAPKK